MLHRLFVDVDHLHSVQCQLDAMTIRVSQINIEGMTVPVMAGSVFDTVQKAELAGSFEPADHARHTRRDIGSVMETRACAFEKYEIVRIILAKEKRADNPLP